MHFYNMDLNELINIITDTHSIRMPFSRTCGAKYVARMVLQYYMFIIISIILLFLFQKIATTTTPTTLKPLHNPLILVDINL